MEITDKEIEAFRAKVWERGREFYRDLPWRNTRDPYSIWISEVMLQQTQVVRVVERWAQWMEKFPTVDALANAQFSIVIGDWMGMGYNSRARRLWDCSKIIRDQYAGQVPDSYEELISLPGIGPATAAGIRAFAYNTPGVYLETNVRTVFIHEFFPNADSVDDKELIPLVRAACPPMGEDVRGWYYALLDYGAYLKKTQSNPSRRSKQYTKQNMFEGSHRQKRSFIVRSILESPQTARQLAVALDEFEASKGRGHVSPNELDSVLEELDMEGLIACNNGIWRIC